MKLKFSNPVINNPSAKYLGLLTFITLHILTYLPVLIWGDDFKLDANSVLKPLKATQNTFELLQNIVNFRYVDLNPVRDLSHYLDFKLSSILELERFRVALFNNYLLFLGIVINFYFFAKKFILNKVALLITLVASFHPIFSNIIFIETWRKHLLAAFFIFLALNIYFYFDINKTKIKLTFSFTYLLSLLAVPIHIFFPFLFLFYDLKIIKMNFITSVKRLFLIFTLSGIIGISNIYYYNITYQKTGLGSKFFAGGDFGDVLLSWGRSIIQVIYPFKYAIFYDLASVENLIGIGVLTFFVYVVFKLKDKKISVFILLLYSLSYLTVTHRPTNQFFFDAYLIFCVFSFLLFTGFSLNKYKYTNLLLISVSLLLCIKTSFENMSKTNYNSYYKIAYNREPACQVSSEVMRILLEENDIEMFKRVGNHTYNRQCIWIGKHTVVKSSMIYKYYLFYSNSFTLDQKIKFIKTKPSLDLDSLLLTILYLDQDKKMAKKYYKTYLNHIENLYSNNKRISKIRKHTHNLLYQKCKNVIELMRCQDLQIN